MSVTINGTNGLVFNDASTQNTAATGFGFKNRIINGDMRINQRGATVTVNANANNYSVDRWDTVGTASAGVFTVQQSTDAPTGFRNSLLATVTTSSSPSAGANYALRHSVEGFNVADFGWGTANASPVTLSFWVKASVAGQYSVGFINRDWGRAYPSTYTINSANTWEYKTITVAGDTSGTWLTDNTTGIRLWFAIGSGTTGTANTWNSGTAYVATGSTNLIATNGATFQITGVQLEKGSTATSFDYRPYGTELDLCQRYYWNATVSGNTQRMFIDTSTSGNRFIMLTPPSEMRANPTISLTVSSGTPNLYGGTSKIIQAYAALGNSTGNTDLTSLTASAEL